MEGNSVFKIRNILKILAMFIIIVAFCPNFLISCGGQDINISALTAVTGIQSDIRDFDPQPVALLLFVPPVMVLILLFIKAVNARVTSVFVILFMGADIAMWFVYRHLVYKDAMEYFDGMAGFSSTGWFYANIGSMGISVILGFLVLTGVLKMDGASAAPVPAAGPYAPYTPPRAATVRSKAVNAGYAVPPAPQPVPQQQVLMPYDTGNNMMDWDYEPVAGNYGQVSFEKMTDSYTPAPVYEAGPNPQNDKTKKLVITLVCLIIVLIAVLIWLCVSSVLDTSSNQMTSDAAPAADTGMDTPAAVQEGDPAPSAAEEAPAPADTGREDVPAAETGSETPAAPAAKVTVGSTVTLKDIQDHISGRASYELYALKTRGMDEFTVISMDDAAPLRADLGVTGARKGSSLLYPKRGEFIMNIDREEFVAFTSGSPLEYFVPGWDVKYFAPIVLSKDLSGLYHSAGRIDTRTAYDMSVIRQDFELPESDTVRIDDLTINGYPVSSIPFYSGDFHEGMFLISSDDSEFADYFNGEYVLVYTGIDSDIEISGVVNGKDYSATLDTARFFFKYAKPSYMEDNYPGERLVFRHNDDGYEVLDMPGDFLPELAEECGYLFTDSDGRDEKARIMIGDQAILSFTSDR